MSNDAVIQALARLFPNDRGVFLAYDQGFEHGPTDFSGENADPDFIMRLAADHGFDAVICHYGIADKYYAPYRERVPLILKLNGKTALHQEEPLSLAIASVEEAMELGAAAVGYTVYVGSEHEAEMLAEFGRLTESAHAAGLPIFGWMYPRGAAIADSHDPDTITYAARVGLEIGADVLKVYYPGTLEKLTELVGVSGRAKVAIAGGVRAEPAEFLQQAKQILETGAAGLAVGRNVWQADDPAAAAAALTAAVHPERS